METCSDSDVSPGVRSSPGLHHGTCLETHRTLVRFQTELEARPLAAGGPHSRRNLRLSQARKHYLAM